MKKGSFYIAIINEEGEVSAKKVNGYIKEEFGLSRLPHSRFWRVTLIPTGQAIITERSYRETRESVLRQAKNLIENRVDFPEDVKRHMETEDHLNFMKSKEADNV